MQKEGLPFGMDQVNDMPVLRKNVGADIMARSSDVGREVVDIIQGVMMFLIAADALLKGWRQHLIVKAAKAEEKEVAQA